MNSDGSPPVVKSVLVSGGHPRVKVAALLRGFRLTVPVEVDDWNVLGDVCLDDLARLVVLVAGVAWLKLLDVPSPHWTFGYNLDVDASGT